MNRKDLEVRVYALNAAPMTEEEKKLYDALTKKQSPCPTKRMNSKGLTDLMGGKF